MTKVAFLDRDGVINKEINYLNKIRDFEYTVNCIEGLLLLISKGYEIVIITNQAGIAKGIFSLQDYNRLTDWMLSNLLTYGIRILECVYCPHHPDGIVEEYSKDCKCRKPKSGMIDYAICKYKVDLESSILIGDKISDIQAGQNAGLNNLFLVSSGHYLDSELYVKNKVYSSILEIAQHLDN